MSTAIIIFVALVIGFVVWLSLSALRGGQNQIVTLGAFSCPACGREYGLHAAKDAREDYLAQCRDARKASPDLKINFQRSWEVRCPSCHAIAHFDFESRRLVPPAV